MRDLIDHHRDNIAKAGVALAQAISEATAEYSATVAASEGALAVAMERRVAAFHGTTEEAPPPPPQAAPPKLPNIAESLGSVSKAVVAKLNEEVRKEDGPERGGEGGLRSP